MRRRGGNTPKHFLFNPMTNNKVDKGFIVKTAATYVAFAAAPFAIALAVSSVFTPPVEAKGCPFFFPYEQMCVIFE